VKCRSPTLPSTRHRHPCAVLVLVNGTGLSFSRHVVFAASYSGSLMKADPTHQPETWQTDAGSEPVAVLIIPGLLSRARVFDIDVTLWVDVPTDSASAWHELRVELDGQQQWSRRIPSHNPGETDSLEYHQRVSLEAEQTLRVRAVAKVKGSRIRRLLVEAREDL
jgi:hypothetical protein